MSNDEGVLGDDAPGRADTRLQERAIRERWPMSAHVRLKVLKRLAKIVDEDAYHGDQPAPGHREVISAARALIAADKLNLDQARLDRMDRPDTELDARHALLGDAERLVDEGTDARPEPE